VYLELYCLSSFALQSALVCYTKVSLVRHVYLHLGNPQFLLKSHQGTPTFIYGFLNLDYTLITAYVCVCVGVSVFVCVCRFCNVWVFW